MQHNRKILFPGDESKSLTFVSDIEPIMFRGRPTRRVLVRCVCNKEWVIQFSKWGRIESCGCRANRRPNLRHGKAGTMIYRRWRNMLNRCCSPDNPRWKYYGGRGIKVCEPWYKFENFYADMGDPPHGSVLDRIDGNGHYEPKNCRWVSVTENNRNRSNTVFIEAFGQKKSRGEWAAQFHIHPMTLRDRIEKRGWSSEKSLSTPVRGSHAA